MFYLAGADPYEDDQLGGLRLTKDGLRAARSDGHRRRRADAGVPLVITLAGGYARRVEDTVAIHAATIEEAALHRSGSIDTKDTKKTTLPCYVTFVFISGSNPARVSSKSVSAYAVFRSTISPRATIAVASAIVNRAAGCPRLHPAGAASPAAAAAGPTARKKIISSSQ